MVVTIEQAEQDLASLMDRVQFGETVVIEKAGRAVGQLVPLSDGKRTFGSLEGHGIVPDDIKTPFEKETNDMFYGE